MTSGADSGSSRPSHREEPSWLAVVRLLRWPLVILALVIAAVALVTRACETVTRRGREAVDALSRGLSSTNLTTSFVASLPHLVPGSGTTLELAAVESVETVTRSENRRLFFDLLSLGTTVTEIRVPVTYRYHVRLDAPWRLDVVGNACVVHAPALEPTLPPAIHTDRMEKRVERTWLQLDLTAQMDALERSLTPTLSARARSPKTVAMVRDLCRRRLAEFVRAWLLRTGHWQDERLTTVVVRFADEPQAVKREGPRVKSQD